MLKLFKRITNWWRGPAPTQTARIRTAIEEAVRDATVFGNGAFQVDTHAAHQIAQMHAMQQHINAAAQAMDAHQQAMGERIILTTGVGGGMGGAGGMVQRDPYIPGVYVVPEGYLTPRHMPPLNWAELVQPSLPKVKKIKRNLPDWF
jgi:hypothetical protein